MSALPHSASVGPERLPQLIDRPVRPGAGGYASYSSVWSKVTGEASPELQARHAAEEFVSMSLVQPILSQLRQSNMAAEPFAPGDFERQFAPLMDAEVSMRIVQAENFPLVDRVARDLLNRFSRTTSATAAGILIDDAA